MTLPKQTMNIPSRKTNTAGHHGRGSPAATRYVCCELSRKNVKTKQKTERMWRLCQRGS